MHQGKEEPHLNRLYLDVPKLVNEKPIIGGKFLITFPSEPSASD
jgi:hypothetical protein